MVQVGRMMGLIKKDRALAIVWLAEAKKWCQPSYGLENFCGNGLCVVDCVLHLED